MSEFKDIGKSVRLRKDRTDTNDSYGFHLPQAVLKIADFQGLSLRNKKYQVYFNVDGEILLKPKEEI